MNFNDITLLLEESAEDMATTFDTYEENGKTIVRFNNKTMSLVDFVKRAKAGDQEAIDVLAKLKQHPKFKQARNLQTFITKFLKDDDKKLDLVIKKGVTQYDNAEIARNSGEAQSKPSLPPRYLRPGDLKPLPNRKIIPAKHPVNNHPGYTNVRIDY